MGTAELGFSGPFFINMRIKVMLWRVAKSPLVYIIKVKKFDLDNTETSSVNWERYT